MYLVRRSIGLNRTGFILGYLCGLALMALIVGLDLGDPWTGPAGI